MGSARCPKYKCPWRPSALQTMVALVLGSMALPLHAQQSLNSPARTDQAAEETVFEPGGTLVGQLTAYLGQGTFVSDEYARNPYFAWLFTALPSYRPSEDWNLSVYLAVLQELTASDSQGGVIGSLTDSEFDTEENKVVLSDLQLRARYAVGTIPGVDIQTTLDGRIILPTSSASRFRNMLFGSRLQVDLTRTFGPVTAVFTSAFRKNFHSRTTATLDPGDADIPTIVGRQGGPEVLKDGTISLPQDNVSFSLYNRLLIAYRPLNVLSLGLSYALLNRFGYRNFPEDEYTSIYASGGLPRVDLGSGMLFASYQILPQIAVEGGFAMVAPPKSSNNRSFRFPFFDFESPANNYGAFYVSLTGSQPFGE